MLIIFECDHQSRRNKITKKIWSRGIFGVFFLFIEKTFVKPLVKGIIKELKASIERVNIKKRRENRWTGRVTWAEPFQKVLAINST